MKNKKLACILTEVCTEVIIKSARFVLFAVTCQCCLFKHNFLGILFGKVIDLNHSTVCKLTYEESLICNNLLCVEPTDDIPCAVATCCHRRPRPKGL